MYIISPSSAQTVICPACHTSQYLTLKSSCRRCHNPLGFRYVAIPFHANCDGTALPGDCLAAEIGAAIRALRLGRGMTRQMLAALSGTHVSYLSRFERGRVVPNLATVARLLRASDVDQIILRIWPSHSGS